MRTLLVSLAVPAVLAGPLAAQSSWRTDFSKHTVPMEEIVSGGPPKDGIPAIDRPRFVPVRAAGEWLDDPEPVAVVRLGGEVKVYPLQILMWHEIVNDEVGGVPVSVTFCPLCNTTLAFDRRFDGRVLDFGTTGRLRNSDLVMYDRQTETWWQQATGEGIVGRYAGERLRFLPAPVTSWRSARETYPDARVLSRETGYRRAYGMNPYERYDSRDGPISTFVSARADGRLPAMERVAALGIQNATPVAVPFSALREHRVIHTELDGRRVAVFWAPGTASALDRERIAQSRDVGSSAAFATRVNDRTLTFCPTGDGRFRDRETGSTWTMSGEAVAGPLQGRRLEEIAHGNHFWFAWGVFRPETEIATQPGVRC